MNDPSGNRYRYGCLALAALGGLLLLLLLWSCRLQPPFAPPPPATPAAAVAEADEAVGAAYFGLSFRHSRLVHSSFSITPVRHYRLPFRHSRESGNPHPAYRYAGTNRGSGFRPTPE